MAIIHRDTDYALRALAHLARRGEVLPVRELAEAEDVPEDFLRKIMQKLQHGGLVSSMQGPLGGYSLRRDPEEITLGDVVAAVQGSIAFNACFEDPAICSRVKVCALRRKLASLQHELDGWLENITVADLAGEVPERKGATG